MNEKTIYLVRHGESEGNVGKYTQGPHGKLTPLGILQAKALASRLVRANGGQPPFTTIIASTDERAAHTAEILGNVAGIQITSAPLFVERRKPSAMFGRRFDAPGMPEMNSALTASFLSGSRVADEETFDDLRIRADRALEYLIAHEHDRISVISHGVFITVMILVALFGNEATPQDLDRLQIQLSNTGLSILSYGERRTWPEHSATGWTLHRLNDVAHLEPNWLSRE